jgi:uncharacterized cupredoxin-like copper-binding protein
MNRVRPLGVAALFVLLVGCSGGGAGAPGSASSQQLNVRALDTFRFEPATLTVKAGQPVQLTLDNGGQTLHDFTLSQGPAQPVTIPAQAGQKGSGTFTVDKPGTYTFICSQPGHEAAGMKGTLTVQ